MKNIYQKPSIVGVMALVLRPISFGTNESDGFGPRARRKPQQYQVVLRGFATPPSGRRRAFMFRNLWVAILALGWQLAAHSVAARSAEELPFTSAALAAIELDELRGGFVSADGLRISIGIERAVFINNELVSTMMLRIPDVADIVARGAAAVELQGSPVTVVQNGPNNTVSQSVMDSLGAGGVATIIQNSLDNQAIRGVTTINATVSGASSLGLTEALSSLNFQLRMSR
jgi:hypothetical protein